MRNISLSDFEGYCVNSLDDCQVFCYDNQSFYAYDKGIVVKKQATFEEIICNLTENLYPVFDAADIPKALDITLCCEKNILYLILYNGDIVSLGVDGNASETIVGSVEMGIKASEWSPDQEVIALITGTETVMVMTNDFEPVSEVNLHGSDFGEKQFITVGWGKKETQFRGLEGKFNINEQKEDELLTSEISDKISISWRGDSEYFVVSSINPQVCKRYLRIFSKGGVLLYTSENVTGLEHCLDWRPSGNLIASTQRLPNKYVVCFFEKNGLRHGEFALPLGFNEIRVVEVLWNKHSKLIALLIVKTSGSDTIGGNKFIQLYTMSNYYWYCKYTINFDCNSVPLLMQWDHQKYNILHVVFKKDKKVYHSKYSWLWVTNKSRGNCYQDESFVAVIDGCKLLLTSFKRGIVPPPICSYVLQMPVSINSVSFLLDSDDNLSNDLLLHLSDRTILFYKFTENNNKIGHELVGKIKIEEDLEFCYNVEWVASKTIMLSSVKMVKEKSQPSLVIYDIKNFDSVISYEQKEVLLESTIAILKASKSGVFIHCNDGQLHHIYSNSSALRTLYPNERRTLVQLENLDKEDGNSYLFSLDNLNKLYVNNNTLFSNVLSFHIHEKFILLTTMNHELLCLNFEKQIPTIDDLSEIFKRKVERGSRVITSVHKDMKVILQMPRGNLECVQPRALSLYVLGKLLDSLKYYEAFDLMRKQRINLNLLFDHDPDSFSKNLNVFVEQVKDIQWISLFLSELTNEDVTKTMYSVIYKGLTKEEVKQDGISKIDLVCGMMEKTLVVNNHSEKYLLPILTCYIKRGKIEFMEAALLKIKELKENEMKGIKSGVSFDEAFRYMLYLIDVEELYKIALGMYDFDLVLIIAAKSQKDPKEYLKFLNDLKVLEPTYQKYVIDKHLKRFRKALSHLVMCDGDNVFNECLDFIQTHQLYKLALKLIPQNTDRYKNVCICYGEELMKSHSYEEAGIMYFNAGMYKNAVKAYQKSGNWQEVVSCLKELKLNENELSELYLDLALELTESKQFKEASAVYLDYLKDVEECVRTLAKGKQFAEAYRISHLYQRTDLINLIIVPLVLEEENLMKLQLTNFKETFVKQRDRLRMVRNKKLEVASESKPEFYADDLYSETNTVITQSNATSRNTNRTYRSAKNRRKQEKKLFSLKEGSPYEDLALITSLHNLATKCVELKLDVRELNKFLIKIKEYEKAEKLQNEFSDLLSTIEHSKGEIWTPDLLYKEHCYGPNATSNEIAAIYMKSENDTSVLLNPKYAIPPETQNNIKWELEILKP